MNLNIIGRGALVVGIILSISAGLTEIPYLTPILLILGLIVGFLNIKSKETTPFLISVITLLVIGLSGLQIELLPLTFGFMLENFMAFVSAAGIIVALKEIFVVARPG